MMELYLEILNWCACLLTIIGTWEVQKTHANLRKINLVYLLGSIIFCVFFGIQGYWINVILYIILGGFAIRGLYHHKLIKITVREDIDIKAISMNNGKVDVEYFYTEKERWIDPSIIKKCE